MINNKKMFNKISELYPQLPHACLVFKYVRMELAVSKTEFARILEISKQYVYQIEKGLRKPSESVVKKICKIFFVGIKKEDFFTMKL